MLVFFPVKYTIFVVMGLIYKTAVVVICLAVLPLSAAIGILVWFDSGRPVIFKQKRIGYKGRKFIIYKFRTMVRKAESLKSKYKRLNEAHGPVFKIYNDPRYTRIGKFLSHTGLDELPQLWNVVKGDMAFIGPRPLPVAEGGKLKPWMKERYNVKPGIISPWIFLGYHNTPFEKWMESDVEYSQSKSLKTDIFYFTKGIIFIFSLFRREMGSNLPKNIFTKINNNKPII